ncbi:hypothetical protein CFHF_08140 [Caulobacter flavus]|uniref:HEAT repeat domain-containing protein n=1 Tax=Caulobacter flavus TaxID=1679497 RepID=A0A2N5CVG3_9CAUL|nr:hypothetical protein [Caulobacter flavus]AYV46877.1 hypothetical protein C1707_11725 [Caulobacter flavus]PLR17785.1 hypothetical protein CFHF_08140 [Caulobacter flavus]
MKASDYRRQYEAELASEAAFTDGLRAAAAPLETEADIPTLLAVATDPKALQDDRQAALEQVHAATFLGEAFDRHRAEYESALRKLITDDAPALRRTALEWLSAAKDEVAQKVLADGLKDPRKALVSAASALEFLSLDEHSAVTPLARLVLERDKDLEARVAALRTLTADPNAADIFARFMRDKDEFKEVRQISAVGLQKLNENLFQKVAQQIAVDDHDFDDIRATALNGLARSPIAEQLLSNPAVRASARAIGEKLASNAFSSLLSRIKPGSDA